MNKWNIVLLNRMALVALSFILIPFFVLAQGGEKQEKAFIWTADSDELEWVGCPEFLDVKI